jgi:Uma2 family endonuclease
MPLSYDKSMSFLIKTIGDKSMSTTIAKWTIEQYHELVNTGVLADRQVELLAGNIIEMAPEGMSHAVYCSDAVDYLKQLLGDQAKVREAHPITLPNDSEPEPDIAVVIPAASRYLDHHPYPADIFWLIEYADSTLTKDLTTKQTIYAQAGILEYWVVNLQASELIVFRGLGSEGYTTETRLSDGTIAPLSFPSIQIAIRKLFT